jgi:hypothetical protein
MRIGLAVVIVAALGAPIAAEFVRVDVQNVPVDRLTANLERQIAERPADVKLVINLARVHAMAYAEKSSTLPAANIVGTKAQEPTIVLSRGDGVPEFQQFDVKTTSDAKAAETARTHLSKAVALYRQALVIAPDNLVAKMGLGWTLAQSGDRPAAIAVLRDLVATSLAKDRKDVGVMIGVPSMTEEAAHYLIPLLDPIADKDEIARLRAAEKELAQKPRWITPIAIPLADRLTAYDVADDVASVNFDLDGSALPQRWTWIRPNAAWLVFDIRGMGSITSGLQLFGNVTFWLFWNNGYDALRSLDDDGDGQIAGRELEGLALWHDRNSNGTSEPGEVRPIADWNVVALSCAYEYDARHPDEIAYSRRGVTFRDGAVRQTFDLVRRLN